MSVSDKAVGRFRTALGRKAEADEILARIEEAAVEVPVAEAVAPLGETTDLAASDITLSTTDTYTDAAVKAAVDAGIDVLSAAVEARLDAIEAKVDALITALTTAGLMAAGE